MGIKINIQSSQFLDAAISRLEDNIESVRESNVSINEQQKLIQNYKSQLTSHKKQRIKLYGKSLGFTYTSLFATKTLKA